MATLLLQTAGRAVGESIGGPFGALIGRKLAGYAGKLLTGQNASATEGPRLTTMPGLSASEGAPIPRVYGRARIGGQIIWATRFIETTNVTRSGGSGVKSLNPGAKKTTYAYAANFAVGLCEGPIAFVRRIWADGKEIDRTSFTARVHLGTPDQPADPLIVAKEGAENALAYRGLAYIVFENFPLAAYGDRIPQLSFEVVRPVAGLCDMIRAVDLIPGASEYGYGVQAFVQSSGGVTQTENRHQLFGASDWAASLDALQALCPNLKQVALVVSWFGDDMRAGSCRIAPRVESRDKTITGAAWSVAGLTRANAPLVSQIDGKPAYGGTPSDDVVRAAIADLRARGLGVLFYPFVMMDVPFGNKLPDPRTGALGQTPFGWRGDILPAAADGTAGVRNDIQNFFRATGETWTYAAFVKRCAQLCVEAGGVDSFLLGSEFRGLTQARDDTGNFPVVAQWLALAAEVRALLGATTKLSYAADWSEYGALSRNGGDEVRFPLDPLWASPLIDFIAIDAYFPMSDWRRTPNHIDAARARSVYDRAYLSSQLAAGEGFDYYYASDDARAAQRRSAITDGACGKPWVFRAKDLVHWWSQPHVERAKGRETAATAWVPRSKPIWFVEAGCPAVDLGANAPNVFPDVKFAQPRLPPFSAGGRDDLMQIRALEAFIAHFDPRCAGHDPAHNPPSDVYAGRMVAADRLYLWAYDARPFPAFPMLASVWRDAQAWDTGHWLNGRLESAPLDALLPLMLRDMAHVSIDAPPLDAIVDGYVIDRPMSPRAALAPLELFGAFEAVASSGRLRFHHRNDGAPVALTDGDLVARMDGDPVELTRIEDAALPRELGFVYAQSEFDYGSAAVLSRRIEGATQRSAQGDLAIVTHESAARRAADIALQEAWAGRESVSFHLRPGAIQFEPGDHVALSIDGRDRRFRIERILDRDAREIVARAVDPAIYDLVAPRVARAPVGAPLLPGPPRVEILDLALARGEPTILQYVAAFADPWQGELAVWRSGASGGSDYLTSIPRSAGIGETLDALGPGPVGRIDRANAFRVTLRGAYLSSRDPRDMLGGANWIAVKGQGGWEALGFAKAELVGARTWRLSQLLRGLGGAEDLATRTLPAGAPVVLLDDSVVALTASLEELGVARRYRIGPADRDPTDPAYVECATSASPLALKPYAPVRARARRVAEGVQISFLRRARRNSDNWDMVDIPLDETSELYQIDILASGTLKRSLRATSTMALYPADQERADFGAPLTKIDLRIAQVSAVAGPGFALTTTLPIL